MSWINWTICRILAWKFVFESDFVSPSNHKYDTQDYDYIDPHYGVIVKDGGDVLAADDRENAHATKYIKRVVNMKNLEASNAFFAKFVEEVHRRGMKVILDGVFNHCGSFNKWLDREKIYDKDESYEKVLFAGRQSLSRLLLFLPGWKLAGQYAL